MAVCIAAANAIVTIHPSSVKGLTQPIQAEITKFNSTYREYMNPVSQKMCSWAAPTYTTSGSQTDRALWIAAQVVLSTALIGLNTYLQNKQYDIAKQYTDLSKQRWERFRDHYAALEKKMLNEVSGTSEPKPDYEDAKSRGNTAVNIAFGHMATDMTRYAKAYALCIDDSLNSDRWKTLARDDTVNFNYRDAENFATYQSDKRWNRRSDILNIGNGNASTAFSYASQAAPAFGSVAASLNQAGQGLSQFFGYMANRNETSYPAQFSAAAPYGNGGSLMITGGPGI